MSLHKQNARAPYLLRFGYLGHYFFGLQPQKDVATVGAAVREHVAWAAQMQPKALQFAARTDAGVHALENYATCFFPKPFDHAAFLARIGHQLPPGLLYLEAQPVAYNVHARASSRGKTYRYVIEDSCSKDTRPNPYAWQIAPQLDIEAMRLAARRLLGEHDFQSFRKRGCSASSSIKQIFSFELSPPRHLPNARQYHFDISGNAFLRQMIRIMMGTLVEVGAGFRTPESIDAILAERDRRAAGVTAPPQGLMLFWLGMDVK